MAESTTSGHTELARLDQRVVEAKQAERAAQAELVRAEQAVEVARDQVREQHDLGADATKATRELQRAKAKAEEAQLAREGVGRRVQRATADKTVFVEQNAARLLGELRPEADRVVDAMKEAAEALLAADSQWFALSSRVSTLLAAANRQPRDHAPGEHELAETIRQLKRAPDAITSPMPHARARAAVGGRG